MLIVNTTLLLQDEPQSNRRAQACIEGAASFQLNLLTDKYADETSFKLEKKEGTSWNQVLHGPKDGSQFHAFSEYSYFDCLPSGFDYKLTIKDSYHDGICCSEGEGTYSYSIDEAVQFDSNSQHTFTDEAVHEFSIGTVAEPIDKLSFEVSYGSYHDQNAPSDQLESLTQPDPEPQPTAPPTSPLSPPTGPPTMLPTSLPTKQPTDPVSTMVTPFDGRSSVCGNGKQQIRINIQFDRYAKENSWELRNTDTGVKVTGEAMGTYKSMDFESLMVCLEDGNYRFTIFDDFGNGICCAEGHGYYELSMDDEIIVADKFGTGAARSNDFIVGYYKQLSITQRELDYLNEHNTRREYWHKKFGGTYVPLKYSMGLAADAKAWAEELLDDCDVDGIKHDTNREGQGENLAKAVGHQSDWGELKPVSNIVHRWVEREATWSWPDNAHFTQALWRASRFMGCGESVKSMGDGKLCRVQVCRYARTGNCGMGDGKNWKGKMMEDLTTCGRPCPPEGCY